MPATNAKLRTAPVKSVKKPEKAVDPDSHYEDYDKEFGEYAERKPGDKLLAAIKELDEGGGKTFHSWEEMMEDLNNNEDD